MKTILISNNGKLFKNPYYSDYTKEKGEKSLSENLGCYVKFEKGVTFKIIFDLILKEKEFFNKVFMHELDGYSLDTFEKEWKKRGKKSYKEDFEIKYLEVQKIYDYFEEGGIDQIDTFTLISVIGLMNGEDVRYSITLIPVSKLKNIEVKISDQVDVFAANKSDNKDEVDIYQIISAKTKITVYELIRSIIFEISMYGSPKEKKKKSKEFLKNINTKSVIPSLQKNMERAIYEERYEDAQELKKIIEKIINNIK